jgi:hypothetical protein
MENKLHEPFTINQIEALSGKLFLAAQKEFPSLSIADLSALLGYTGSKMLNTANDHPVFKVFGGFCYDILTYNPANDDNVSDST